VEIKNKNNISLKT